VKLANRLLVLLIVVCLGLVTVSCQCAGGGGASVALVPSPKVIKPSEQFEVKVQVEPEKQGVSAVEVKLSFEPQTMQVVEVKPGALLGERPLPGILNIDNEAGALSYSLARIGTTEVPTPAATFAVITFQVLNSAQPGDCELSFTSVGLANEKLDGIEDIRVKGTSVKIGS
jgi:hypothetical protein